MTVNNPISQGDARRGTQEPSSVLIVGAGNFGASAALHFAKQGTPVTLVDTAHYPNPRAASHDINKIVRGDYPDTLYMEMLRKAMPLWRKDKLYSPWYHEVGMLRADPSDFGDRSMQAYREVGIANDSRYMTVEEVRERWEAYSTSNFDGLSKVLYNPTVGFAEADKALGAVVQAAIDAGTHYEIGEMSSLALGPTGECRGIHLKDGRTLYASQILMATGARTPALLAQSAPGNKYLHIGDRLVATGAVSFHAKLHGAQKDKFAAVPVLKNCMPQVKGEGMSILPDGTIKFNCDMCFTNYQTLSATGEKMSLVPESNFFNTWTDRKFLDFFERRARMTINGLYGDEVKHVPIDAYRMCWDASTPTHDFLITAHPHSQNLYIATGGSFHGWKFLPVIGDYIVQLMEGTLSAELTDRWAWDKKGGDGHSANPTYQVAGDLQDWTDDIEYA
ncbi:sarcosine oxidase [Emericellopsis atlantica]|uniref:Sarcosine oxidase n=1 Tax=Emericellopsis atlantica TaxID=2614577 RepID=A0A9P8CPX9_9HYPO|nr:sarcosine oxidase [Emericellopsis atlantica]KAG9254682.1 sarcosine oxidase [Emericellopsis atlantica]